MRPPNEGLRQGATTRMECRDLLFDLGNTRAKAARRTAQGLGPVQAFAYAETEVWARLEAWVAEAATGGARAWIASVTRPGRTRRLAGLLRRHGLAVHRVGPPVSDACLELAYADPTRLGVDRWLAMRAVRRRLQGPFVLAACGSALTVDAVDAQGRHLGGVIAPAPERALEALRARAPHLPPATGPVTALARDTASALHSGAWLSAVGLIGLVQAQAAAATGGSPRLVLTGGGAGALQALLAEPAERLEHAVLQGLADLAEAAA